MTSYTLYEYFLPVCGVVILSCLITCCRYCCFASSVKAQNAANTSAQGGSAGEQRRIPTISAEQGYLESDLLGYQPPAELPRYLDGPDFDPPPDFGTVNAAFPVGEEPPPAYEDIVSRNQQPVT